VALLTMLVYVDSGGLIGYVGVCGQWCPYWLCGYMWTVVALLTMLVYVGSGGLIGYVGVCTYSYIANKATTVHIHLHSQ
jgi:hypothetical protein